MAHPVYNVLAVGTSVHPAAELFQQTLFYSELKINIYQ